MRTRTLTASAAAVTVALGTVTAVVANQNGGGGGTTPVAAPTPTPAGGATTPAEKGAAPGDFNGDGYADIADIADGNLYGAVKGRRAAGFVTVVYGGPKGASAARHQIVTNPDGARRGDLFGHTLASADLDHDGRADLVVGQAGASGRVIYGGARGLTARTAVLPGGSFGRVAAGDLDGNGVADLVTTGSRDIRLYLNPGAEPGAPQVSGLPLPSLDQDAPGGPEDDSIRPLVGDFDGDRRTDLLLVHSYRANRGVPHSNLVLRRGTGGGLGPAETFAQPANQAIDSETARTGDVNGDGRTDLVYPVTTRPGDAEAFAVRLGAASGFTDPHHVALNGFGPAAEGAHHGGGLAVGDTDGDGRAEIAVGLGRGEGGGTVLLVRGTGSGPSTGSFQLLGQDGEGVPGTDEKDDRFGQGLAFRDTDGDRRADLVVGVPGENGGEGRLYVFPGTAKGGLTTKGVANINTPALGIAGDSAFLGGDLLF
ncbi:hypothetical protein GCM10009678_81920 [Actinomadura kijaniata]|uniref:Integrin-like protein n=1 Tax=Actinomadura namibiensis TaxID=182080 RepID=A0A7W3QQN0_ACTNM|nr:FG-GAP and VCBS repeat-containing protein [Actinomadura namibiensis]MBA8955811.1 hypothetical protein [Actinomadura namibiensis]